MAMKKVVKIVKDDKGSLLINDDGTQQYYEGLFAEMNAPQEEQLEDQAEVGDDLLEQYMTNMKAKE
jgi:hypothetical protein